MSGFGSGGFSGSFGFPQSRKSSIVLRDGGSITNVRVDITASNDNYVLELCNDGDSESWEEFTGENGGVHEFSSGDAGGVKWRLTGSGVVFSSVLLKSNVEV